MVQPKGRVAGADVKVARWVAADGVVSARVHAPLTLVELALEYRLEPVHVVVLGDEGVRVVGRGDGRRVPVDVAPEAAGVVAEAVGLRVGLEVGELGGEGAQVNRHSGEGVSCGCLGWGCWILFGGGGVLGKGAFGHAAAASADGDPIEAGKRGAENDRRVGLLKAVARQAELIAVEQNRVLGVLGVAAPVPVWLVARVAALSPEGVLVVPEIVPVPWEEKGLWRVGKAS